MPLDSHSFRYEPELCTLAEGQTLRDWRTASRSQRDAKRRLGRRVRPRLRRGAPAVSSVR